MNLELNDIQAEVLTRENPTALDAGALIDAEVFNHRHGPGGYFGDFYEDWIKTCIHRAALECSRCRPLVPTTTYSGVTHWWRSITGSSPSRGSSQASLLSKGGDGVRECSSLGRPARPAPVFPLILMPR